MDREKLIELTNKLYKITLLFPKKEPLRYKMREAADDILAFGREKDLEVLKRYFEVAKWQNWVSYFDLLEIEEEYDKINPVRDSEGKEEAQKESISNGVKIIRGPSSDVKKLDERKEKILIILKEREKIQVGEVQKVLPNVSKRTLRRDFEFLLKQGIVERIGERNDTFYQLRGLTRV